MFSRLIRKNIKQRSTSFVVFGCLLSGLAVTGCASVPITLASVAVSGISLAFTGKGVVDYALSDFNGEDCAMLHVFEGLPVCVPDEDGTPPTVAVAALQAAEPATDLTVASGPTAMPPPDTGEVAASPGFPRGFSVARPLPPSVQSSASVESDPLWRYMMARVKAGGTIAASPIPDRQLAEANPLSRMRVRP